MNEVRGWEGSLRMNKGYERRQRPRCSQVQGEFSVLRVDDRFSLGGLIEPLFWPLSPRPHSVCCSASHFFVPI